MPGRSTSGFHQPGRHCSHQARSAVRCSASHMERELHASKDRSQDGLRHLVPMFLLMDDSANGLIFGQGAGQFRRRFFLRLRSAHRPGGLEIVSISRYDNILRQPNNAKVLFLIRRHVAARTRGLKLGDREKWGRPPRSTRRPKNSRVGTSSVLAGTIRRSVAPPVQVRWPTLRWRFLPQHGNQG